MNKRLLDSMLNCQDNKWIEYYTKQLLLKQYGNDK